MEGLTYQLDDIIRNQRIEIPEETWDGYLRHGMLAGYNLTSMRGVYEIYELKTGDIIYIGVSIDIQSRLMKHYHGTAQSSVYRRILEESGIGDEGGSKGLESVELEELEELEEYRDNLRVRVYEIPHTAYANMLEAYLISIYQPRYNTESDGKGRGNSYYSYRPSELEENKVSIIRQYTQEKKSLRDLAKVYGYSPRTISRYLDDWGIQKHNYTYDRYYEEDKHLRIVKEYLTTPDLTYKDISNKYGVSVRHFGRWVRDYREEVITYYELEPSQIHHKVRLTQSEREEIIDYHKGSSNSIRATSRRYNISPSTLSNWLKQEEVYK